MKWPISVRQHALQVVEHAPVVADGELVEGEVQLDVGVPNLTGLGVVGHGGLRDVVVEPGVRPLVVLKHHDVRVLGPLVVLGVVAGGVVELGERNRCVPALLARYVGPGEERPNNHGPHVFHGQVLRAVGLDAESRALALPEERMPGGLAHVGVARAIAGAGGAPAERESLTSSKRDRQADPGSRKRSQSAEDRNTGRKPGDTSCRQAPSAPVEKRPQSFSMGPQAAPNSASSGSNDHHANGSTGAAGLESARWCEGGIGKRQRRNGISKRCSGPPARQDSARQAASKLFAPWYADAPPSQHEFDQQRAHSSRSAFGRPAAVHHAEGGRASRVRRRTRGL